MAKVIIVDEEDNEIGLKERGTIDPKNDIVRVSGLWITNSKNQVLLAQRKLTKKYNAGNWGLAAGGTVEEGETYESNIYKEAEEEIGLRGETFKAGQKFYADYPNKRFSKIFSLQVDYPIEHFKVQEDEVEKLCWFDIDQLRDDLLKNPDNYTQGAHKMMEIEK